MAVQEVTIRLPLEILQQIQRAAARTHRSVDDVLVEAVIAAAPSSGAASAEAQPALAQMAYLNDASLWQAARATMSPDQRKRLEYLHDQQQRAPLTDEERSEEQTLLELYRGTVLVRAHAALLLKRRGYDISDLDQFAPLE
ncbi:MAG: hypothetical protein ACRDJE_07860 [Dehalococcoidia bacterium]